MFGQVLHIDLTEKNYVYEELDASVIRKFLGGRGLGIYLIYRDKLYSKNINVYSGDNPLIILSGPVCGTRLPMATRATAVFKSPLTNRWNYSTVGGTLAARMRYAGVDVLYITGKSRNPLYLYISGKEIRFLDASELWGLETVETERLLKKKHGENVAVLTIGPAGENLVPYSLINHEEWRQFGREGGGAVMGSKNLKAIVFKPLKYDVDIADKDGYKEILKELVKLAVGPATRSYRSAGTLVMIDIANEMGFFPSYYWDKVVLDDWKNISWNEVLKDKYFVKSDACLFCPVACHRVMKAGENKVYDLEYESAMALGGLVGINDPSKMISLCELADRLGLDTISLGNSIAFAIYLSKKGILKEDLDWGDYGKIKKLIISIARREGIGELISKGVKAMAEELGVEDLALHVKGLEPPGYDPRTLKGMILNYAVAERGADHLWSSAYAIDIPGKGGGRFNTGIEKVKAVMDLEERNAIYDSAILCKFGRTLYLWENLVKALNVVTGFGYTVDELRRTAQRIIILHRYINKTTMEDDKLPPRWIKESIELEGRKYVVTKDEWRNMLKIYYELRKYNDDGSVPETRIREIVS